MALSAGAISILPAGAATSFAAAILVILAVTGICALFLVAFGFLRFSGEAGDCVPAKLICEASGDGLIAVTANGKILYANEAYLALAGAKGPHDATTLEHLLSRWPEASPAVYRLTQAARSGSAAAEEIRISPPLGGTGGGAGWYLVKVRPLPRSGITRGAFWSIADITHPREQQGHAVKELRRRAAYLDYAPAGFLSWSRAGEIDYMNATLAGWLGYGRQEIGTARLTLADLAPADGQALAASLSGGAGGKHGGREFDTVLRCRSGQSPSVRLLCSVLPHEDGAAETSCALVLKRPASDDLAGPPYPGEELFAGIFASLPIAIAVLGRKGEAIHWNNAFARLMPDATNSSGCADKAIFAAIRNKDHAAVAGALAAAFRGTFEIAPVDAGLAGEGDRSARLFFAAAAKETQSGAIVYALDTTEQRALQSNFAQSNKMQAIGQLAGGVAHDFNNVLTAIIGHCDLLLANHRPTDPSFRDINQIKQNANRAARLVRQLLAFSRRQTLRPQILQLGDVLSDLQEMMKRLVGEKTTVELRHGRDLWLVRADLSQFEQVIMNLIVNARDAMPDGGKIILRTHNVLAAECAIFSEPSLVPSDYVAIEVEDFGHGMAPDVRDKIFEPFFTTKEVGKGTGLGLATVYGIVKQTEGYIFCSSEVGKGTKFTILLPRYIPDGPALVQVGKRDNTAADLTGHETILLVEDEEAVRAFCARALASRGYTVLQAASGIEALHIAAEQKGNIDLVVSDVIMPEMDGPAMFTELCKRGIKARVIFVSGYADEAFAHLPKGEDFGFLQKPFSLKQLIEAVKGKL
ncbi:MAG: response regulator [Methylocapsa sp.]|nr:response regulator [Methylocapsa sp.]